jgi:hypothetical protein
MKKIRRSIKPEHAKLLGLDLKPNQKGRNYAQYQITDKQNKKLEKIKIKDNKVKVSSNSDTKPNDYKEDVFFLSAYCKETNSILNIEDYCNKYNLDYSNVSSFKFLPYHYKEPSYNIVFKENIISQSTDIDFDNIIKKHINPIDSLIIPVTDDVCDFETLTISDVHIGMDTDKFNNSMYPVKWDKESVLYSVQLIVNKVLENRKSNTLIVDELGDFLDGFNGKTTRGGHDLPQNMTNEECFDLGLEFKVNLMDMLQPYYEKIIFNNICNDNHAGSFGYFVNSAFKGIGERKYNNVEIINYRQFISHYFVNEYCFLITHGKDDSTLKFGFKPQLDANAIEKIDQYCKHNKIYNNCKKIIFKKGDSHQMLLDMCTSDDFYYYNYPALSPSSQWVQNNFKKGRRGFVLEYFNGLENEIKPIFI